MRRIATLSLALALVSACQEDPRGATMPEDSCGAEALQHFVGQPESAAAGIKGPGAVRVLRPGMAVTMDFSPTRLNIGIGPDGRIATITCG